MTPTDDLFKLIKSLSASEKREFKKLASLRKGDKAYVLLFDAIDKQEVYDERKLKKKFAQEAFVKQFTWMKNYLYKMILKALRYLHDDISHEVTIKSRLIEIEILYKKRLFEQCQKLINKTQKIIEENDHTLYKAEFYSRWKYNLLISTQKIEDEQIFDDILRQLKKQLDLFYTEYQYYIYSGKLNLITIKYGSVRNGEEEKKIMELYNKELLEKKLTQYSFKTQFMQLFILFNFSRLLCQIEDEYELSKKLLKLYKENKLRSDKSKLNYITISYAYVSSCLRTKRYEEFQVAFNELEKIDEKRYDPIEKFRRTSILDLQYHIVKNEFNKIYPRIKPISNKLDKHGDLVSLVSKTSIYCYFGYICFRLEKYGEAIDWLNVVLNNKKAEQLEEQYTYTKILNLMVHYDLGNSSLVEYEVVSLYRYLLKKKRNYEFETILINFLRKQAPKLLSKEETKTAFNKLSEDIKLCLEKRYDREAFRYLDIVVWLESKYK